MSSSTGTRVRLRDLGRLGRCQPVAPGGAGLHRLAASRRRAGADSAAIDTVPPPRPSVPSSRPGANVPMELLI